MILFSAWYFANGEPLMQGVIIGSNVRSHNQYTRIIQSTNVIHMWSHCTCMFPKVLKFLFT